TGASWLPQPSTWRGYAVSAQAGVAGSTLELYRAALRLRREHRLGHGALAWVDLGPEVVAFRNGQVLVVVNLGSEDVRVEKRVDVVLRSDRGPACSGEADDLILPTDTALWAILRETDADQPGG
ncbi:MAG TPA: DUF3459 domain-containing protein, partial [Dermatophilaceae bacterium]|nr:DUF3459 domain-containing protein [Dermatophilaceae bacterium]